MNNNTIFKTKPSEYDEADQYAIYSHKRFQITNVRLVVNHNDIKIPKNELKDGEIEAIISKVGCYIVRRGLCKSTDNDYIYHEVSARHIDDVSGKFNIVCSARIPLHFGMVCRIKSISVIKENIYMPDNYASLQICEEISPLSDIPYYTTFRMSPTGEVKEIY